jgi:hypothetical protein
MVEQPLHYAHGRLLIAKPIQTNNFPDYSLDIQAIICGFGMKNSVVMHQKIILQIPLAVMGSCVPAPAATCLKINRGL